MTKNSAVLLNNFQEFCDNVTIYKDCSDDAEKGRSETSLVIRQGEMVRRGRTERVRVQDVA